MSCLLDTQTLRRQPEEVSDDRRGQSKILISIAVSAQFDWSTEDGTLREWTSLWISSGISFSFDTPIRSAHDLNWLQSRALCHHSKTQSALRIQLFDSGRCVITDIWVQMTSRMDRHTTLFHLPRSHNASIFVHRTAYRTHYDDLSVTNNSNGPVWGLD